MVYTWNEIVKIEGDINKAYKSVEERKYKKVSHGVYVDDGEQISELEQLFVRYPRATLTLQSAFDYYELSDYIPDKYYLVTPYNAHTINNSKVYQSYMNAKANKDFARADAIRDELLEKGVKLIDSREGTTYELI